MPGKAPYYIDIQTPEKPSWDMADGDPFECSLDFSNPRRNEVDPEDVLALWLENEGVARSDLPGVQLGDKRHFKVTLTESGREATGIFECVRMTSGRLFFLPAGA